jgi:predicted O-methyltransferase YrrM
VTAGPGPDGTGTGAVTWIDERHLEVGGASFVSGAFQEADDGDELLIIKSPALIARYLDLLERERPRVVVELGVKAGGSTGLIALVAEPDVLVAVDLAPEVPPRLAQLIRSHGLEDRIVPGFGIDQSDREALVALVDRARGDRPLDLVVDDASHLLDPTIASFDALFPRLRPGGVFVIEDWSADYRTAQELARSIPADRPDFAQQLSRARTLFGLLNSPTATLPPEVVASLTAAAATIEASEHEAPDGHAEGGPYRLLGRIVEVAGRADLSALDDAPRSLVDLAVRLMLARAASDGAIAEVLIDGEWLLVRRGPGPLDPDGFRLADISADHLGYLAGA